MDNASGLAALNGTLDYDDYLATLKISTYRVCLPLLIAIGVSGNILNLITLNSPDLRSAPFTYIRAMAVFDSLSLPLVGLACDRLWRRRPVYGPVFSYYQAHVERPLINILLTASLFVACVLTVERYYLICRPYAGLRTATKKPVSRNGGPKASAKLYIFGCALTSALLHASMPFEKTYKCSEESECIILDNVRFASVWLRTSRLAREIVCRALPVLLLAVLNAAIMGEVRRLNERRRRMTRIRWTRAAETDIDGLIRGRPEEIAFQNRILHRKSASLANGGSGYSEKRLTTTMAVVTVVYVIGNVPQSISMIMNSDSKRNDFGYQLFRSFANGMEICHHCLNFYVFCLTCADYRASFRRRCRTARRMLVACRQRSVGNSRGGPSEVDSDIVSAEHPDEPSVIWSRENDLAFCE